MQLVPIVLRFGRTEISLLPYELSQFWVMHNSRTEAFVTKHLTVFPVLDKPAFVFSGFLFPNNPQNQPEEVSKQFRINLRQLVRQRYCSTQ